MIIEHFQFPITITSQYKNMKIKSSKESIKALMKLKTILNSLIFLNLVQDMAKIQSNWQN